MNDIELVSANKSFGGWMKRYRHRSQVLHCDMVFGIYLPPQADQGKPLPVLYWLSGLTCTDENFMQKAGAQRLAAELGMVIVAPDTSPRGEGVPDDAEGAYDFGLGAGFYVNATEQPWAQHYRMYDYVVQELPGLIEEHFPVSDQRSISGHSMGGHGALTIALRNPARFKAVSAFAPIASPINCPWGNKALPGYLGDDRDLWRRYDACALIEDGARLPHLLVDQGTADDFLENQLKTGLLAEACEKAGIAADIRMQDGYDHSYYFISTFMAEHVSWHAKRLTR
ncbi:S-formylglutathione hydrolase [Stutzerimonas kunmingensis]|uniref:S-formylglutathione hydrolase n=1 Tax=Stutzerimonas kunmingensis TaxID=1211807 RepID=UPI00241BF901|nr:S-formylglutathione hydrolase [Stutzerimonas kunmingensis]